MMSTLHHQETRWGYDVNITSPTNLVGIWCQHYIIKKLGGDMMSTLHHQQTWWGYDVKITSPRNLVGIWCQHYITNKLGGDMMSTLHHQDTTKLWKTCRDEKMRNRTTDVPVCHWLVLRDVNKHTPDLEMNLPLTAAPTGEGYHDDMLPLGGNVVSFHSNLSSIEHVL